MHALAVLTAATLLAGASVSAAESPELVARSLVSAGDATRLQHVLARARRGEHLVIGVIGGSITAGAKASRWELNYGSLLTKWFRDTFPGATFDHINAGIGATGSNFGVMRLRRDLLSRRPDLVVVEYAVNDANSRQSAETVEGLVRQILAQPNQPAVMMLFQMGGGGGNAQEWLSKVGAHYHLPMVSFRDAMWPAMQAKQIAWSDVIADEVHPNDRGHAAMAQFLAAAIETVRAALPPDAQIPAIGPVPAPLYSDQWDRAALYEAEGLHPTLNQGFTLDNGHGWDKGWRADQPGSVIEFDLEGTVLYLMQCRVRGPLGMAKITVDDGAPRVVDTWFAPTWGGWRETLELARGLAPGRHKVRVEVLADKNPESTGHEYRLLALGAAGIPAPAPAELARRYDFNPDAASDAKPIGTPTYPIDPERHKHVLHLDGQSQALDLPAFDLGERFSLTAWVKLEDNPVPPGAGEQSGRQQVAMILASSPIANRDGLFWFLNNQWGGDMEGRLQVESFVGGPQYYGRLQTQPSISRGAWHHVALTADRQSGEARLYLDRKPVFETLGGTFELARTTTTRPWRIGAALDGGFWFKGCLDDLRIYRGMLTEEEIAGL